MPLQRVWTLPWLGSRLQPPEIAGLGVMALAAWPTMLANILIAALYVLPLVRWAPAARRAAAFLLLAALAATVSKSGITMIAGALVAGACLSGDRRATRRLLVAAAAAVAVAYIAATHFVVASPSAARALTTNAPVIGTDPVLDVPVGGREL